MGPLTRVTLTELCAALPGCSLVLYVVSASEQCFLFNRNEPSRKLSYEAFEVNRDLESWQGR